MVIKLVLFDLDDTLLNSGKAIIEHHRKTAERMGIRVPSYMEIAKLVSVPWERVIKKLWPDVDVKEFQRVYRAHPKDLPLTLIDGALETVKAAKAKFRIGILTARDRESTSKNLKKFGFPEFEFVATGSDEVTKPEPEVFYYVLKNFSGIKPSETLYIGDGVTDFECSKKAGVNFIGVLTGNFKEEDFKAAGANTVLKSVKELPKLFEEKFI